MFIFQNINQILFKLQLKNNLYDKGTNKQFKNDLRVLVDNKCPNFRFYVAFWYEGNVKILLEYMNIGS